MYLILKANRSDPVRHPNIIMDTMLTVIFIGFAGLLAGDEKVF